MKFRQFWSLFRAHQYIKNIFIFTPLMFSMQFSQAAIGNALFAFFAFCFIASSVYIFNDLMDLEQDKAHPRKQFRALASGKVSQTAAVISMLCLILLAVISALQLSVHVLYLLLGYLLLNIAYSIKLKHIAIIDIFIIASGFVIRVVVGAQATGVHLSMWLVIMTFLLALFLAFAKRRDDVLLATQGLSTRKNIDGYNLEFINAGMVVMSAVIIVCYILYSVSAEVVERIGSQYLYTTTLFVILGILRYMQLTFVNEESESPTRVVLKDRFLQLTIILWLLTFFGIAYL